MSLELDPPELGFARPFSHEVINYLHLRNPHNGPIAFKVKTTAPKQYCVRPNSGRVEPGAEVEVHVILQAMKEDPPLDARCRDKFLVQSAPIPPDHHNTPAINTIWQYIDNNYKSSIAEKKIRVNFLAPGGSTPHRNLVNGVHNQHTPMSQAQPPPPYQASDAFNTPSGPASSISSRPAGAKGLDEIRSEVHNPATDSRVPGSGTAASAAAAVSNAVPKSREELQQLYDGAQAKIKELMAREKSAPASGEAGSIATMTQGAQANGVPLQITAALCLLSFLIAYFLF